MLRAKMVSVLFTTLQNSYNLSLLVLARIYIFGFFINAMYEKVVEVVDINGYIIFFSRLKNWRDNTFFKRKNVFIRFRFPLCETIALMNLKQKNERSLYVHVCVIFRDMMMHFTYAREKKWHAFKSVVESSFYKLFSVSKISEFIIS
jgi:hypothetical protein